MNRRLRANKPKMELARQEAAAVQESLTNLTCRFEYGPVLLYPLAILHVVLLKQCNTSNLRVFKCGIYLGSMRCGLSRTFVGTGSFTFVASAL